MVLSSEVSQSGLTQEVVVVILGPVLFLSSREDLMVRRELGGLDLGGGGLGNRVGLKRWVKRGTEE